MLAKKIKDIKFRKFFKKEELKNKVNSFLFINQLNKKNMSLNLIKTSVFLKKKKTYKNQIVRRCIINNRNRSSLKHFNISRILLRDMFLFGVVPGYKKAVW
jgi:ribosomal protein S14